MHESNKKKKKAQWGIFKTDFEKQGMGDIKVKGKYYLEREFGLQEERKTSRS